MKDIQKKIKEIIMNIKTKYLNADGMVSSRYPPDGTNLLDHMEDYTPLMLHLGEKEFVRDQILRSGKFTYEGLIRNRHRVVSYMNSEYLSALFNYYELHKDRKVKQMIETALASLNRLLVENGFIKTYYDTKKKRSPSITTPMTSSLLEVMLVNHVFSDKLVPLADCILNNWIKVSFFRKYGLFPSKYYISNTSMNYIFLKENIPLSPKIKNQFEANFFSRARWIDCFYRFPWGVHVQVCKDNTNMIFALIQGFRVLHNAQYKKAIHFWIESVREKLFKDNLLHRFWRPSNQLNNIELTGSFAVIDVLCDVYFFIDHDPEYLNFAEEIAHAWISRSTWRSGLLPRKFNGTCDHLDDQTDFSISLLRLSELTGKKEYRDLAENLAENILQYHYTEDGYVTSVNESENKSNKIEPKYNALLLKLLIILSENKKIYGDDYTHQLVKDR